MDQELPSGFDGVELRSWEGVTVVRDAGSNSSSMVWLYLAQDHPAEIWRYRFSLLTGFAGCAVSIVRGV